MAILVRTLMDGLWTIMDARGRCVDAQPTFEDAGKNWSCDGHGHATDS